MWGTLGSGWPTGAAPTQPFPLLPRLRGLSLCPLTWCFAHSLHLSKQHGSTAIFLKALHMAAQNTAGQPERPEESPWPTVGCPPLAWTSSVPGGGPPPKGRGKGRGVAKAAFPRIDPRPPCLAETYRSLGSCVRALRLL